MDTHRKRLLFVTDKCSIVKIWCGDTCASSTTQDGTLCFGNRTSSVKDFYGDFLNIQTKKVT